MSYHLNSNSNNEGNTRPVKINLTPSSEQPASSKPEPLAPTTPTGLFSNARLGINHPTTPILSSTCASVDSDSDYQGRDYGSTFDDSGDTIMNNHSGVNAISRPLSRTSTMSGVSTTATKDGVEGNRLHRFHDPLGYAKWISSTFPDDMASSTSTPDNGTPFFEDDDMMGDPESENASSYEDEEVLKVAAEVAAKARIGKEQGEPNSNSSSGAQLSPGASSSRATASSHQQQLLYHHQQQLQELGSDASSFAPTPPNNPSAPPVTLTEKIRLLRTGSVSRKSQ